MDCNHSFNKCDKEEATPQPAKLRYLQIKMLLRFKDLNPDLAGINADRSNKWITIIKTHQKKELQDTHEGFV